jgi:glycosyltransferase involved in cell wall biosynthesis
MHAKALITIIIPTFNSANFIQKCLDSIRVQTYNDYEILIIDGLSKDNTLSIIKLNIEKDNRIHFSSEKDKGTYDAMNKGIRLAKGDWLYFLGSDDELYDPQVLQKVSSVLGSTSADVVYGDVKVEGNAGWATDGAVYDGLFDTRKLLLKNICHQSIFYRKHFIAKDNISFNEKYPVCADWDFNVRCWAKGRFEYIPQIIARFNAGGASTKEVIHDDFGNEIIEKFMSYSSISSYNKLKTLIPSERMYQLRKFKKYSWRMRIDSLAKRFLS